MRKLIFIVLLAMPIASLAAESQFYFVGKAVISQDPVPDATHVYLRWDVVEGQLPSDVVTFRLMRNGDRVGEWSANAVMEPPAISALYNGADHQRRRLETITRLNEIASDAGLPFSANQFSKTLYQLIDPASGGTFNPLWAFLGSRTDFNIARARYRGWIDTAPEMEDGVAKYELLGVNASDVTARLGYVEIDPTVVQQSLGASMLRQLRVTDWECDLPGTAKDQYTVMLDWESPGANVISDRVAAQSYISGFDLYRGTDNLAPNILIAPVLDIADLAPMAGTDSRGRPTIAGLEKVNVPLIIDSGAPADDQEWLEAKLFHQALADRENRDLPIILPANIPTQPKWLEARDQLIRAGLKPGDRRAYYLVPRDFTGNYGPTIATIVEIPKMTRPPAPWNLRTFADETSSVLGGLPDALTFTWDEVDLSNYIKMYRGTRLFCNTVEASTTGVLEYVAVGESCETGHRNAVRLDVSNYRVYRFTDFDVAGRFKDSDGDGVEDSAETEAFDFDGNGRVDAFERSAAPQCDASIQPAGADNYLFWPKLGSSVKLVISSDTNPAPPRIARMRDTVPAGTKDTVYWYRVVSEATLLPSDVDDEMEPYVGRLSHMSAPQRGLFPDREPPPPPLVGFTRPGTNASGCELESNPNAPWSFSESVSENNVRAGTPFVLSCSAGPYIASEIAATGVGACPDVVNDCAGVQPVFIQFPATTNTGGKVCTVRIPDDVSVCESGGLNLVPTYDAIPVGPGDLVSGGPTGSAVPSSPNTCVAVFETIDGTSTRIGSTCDPGGLSFIPRPGLFCGYAVATDENNNFSATVQFPCTLTPLQTKAPSAPQVLTLDVDNDLARFTFRLPAEQVAMTLARLDYDPGVGSNVRTVDSIAVIDNDAGEAISFSMPVDPLLATRDRFCLSLLSVGRDDGRGSALSSKWSTEKCFTRTAMGEDIPTYLPWPAVQGAIQGDPLAASLVTNLRGVPPFLAIELAESTGMITDVADSISDCWIGESPPQDFDTYGCFSGGVARFKSLVSPELDFIVYRQSRINAGEASDWVQVSPLIDYVHFDRQVLNLGDRDVTVWGLNDPYIKVTGSAGLAPLLTVLFIDQYPFIINADLEGAQEYEWRYQLVYFDDQHRPVKWRGSDWFRSDEQ
jgi:hypothetical protein